MSDEAKRAILARRGRFMAAALAGLGACGGEAKPAGAPVAAPPADAGRVVENGQDASAPAVDAGATDAGVAVETPDAPPVGVACHYPDGGDTYIAPAPPPPGACLGVSIPQIAPKLRVELRDVTSDAAIADVKAKVARMMGPLRMCMRHSTSASPVRVVADVDADGHVSRSEMDGASALHPTDVACVLAWARRLRFGDVGQKARVTIALDTRCPE